MRRDGDNTWSCLVIFQLLSVPLVAKDKGSEEQECERTVSQSGEKKSRNSIGLAESFVLGFP